VQQKETKPHLSPTNYRLTGGRCNIKKSGVSSKKIAQTTEEKEKSI